MSEAHGQFIRVDVSDAAWETGWSFHKRLVDFKKCGLSNYRFPFFIQYKGKGKALHPLMPALIDRIQQREERSIAATHDP